MHVDPNMTGILNVEGGLRVDSLVWQLDTLICCVKMPFDKMVLALV